MKRSNALVAGLLAMGVGGVALAQDAEEARRQEVEAARQEQEAMRQEQEAMRQELEQARQELHEAAQRVAELSRKVGPKGEAFVYEFMTDENRGMIGVVLDRDGEDLKIVSVTPGGPAEEAGVKAGDVVVAVNGEAVPAASEARGVEIHIPEGLQDLEVGDQVTLTLKGDDGTREVAIEAGRRESMQWENAMREFRRLRLHAPPAPGMPRIDEDVRHKIHNAMERIHIRVDRGWGRVELTRVNEDLGHYFGTDSGLLVVNAPEDNPLGLKAGDVIKRIGDREPKDPAHAFRIVRSYHDGETLEVEVLRDGSMQTLSHVIDKSADEELGWAPRWAPDGFAWEFEFPETAP